MKIGIIVNNIGTPTDCTPKAVAEYLSEFLMDKEIIPIPFLIRYILVNFLIVPRRKYSSAKKYQSIWKNNKSPLLEISERFSEKLQAELNKATSENSQIKDFSHFQFQVEVGMRYGAPSIDTAVQKLVDFKADKIIFLPMYPQYARETTKSSEDLFLQLMQKYSNIKTLVINEFYKEPSFIDNSVQFLQDELQKDNYDHILFSYHGLPDTPRAMVYKNQCYETSKLIATKANLKESDYTVCFQSRLGPKKWITPYTSKVGQNRARVNKDKKLLVQTPSFTVDCLETLEEIAEELKEDFIHAGGEKLIQVSCLNDDEKWVKDFSKYILNLSY